MFEARCYSLMPCIQRQLHLFDLPQSVLTQIVIEVASKEANAWRGPYSFASGFDRTSRRCLDAVIDAANYVITADAAFKVRCARAFVTSTRRAVTPPPFEPSLVHSANQLLAGIANLRLPFYQTEWRRVYDDAESASSTLFGVTADRNREPPLMNSRSEVVAAVAALGLTQGQAEWLVANAVDSVRPSVW